LIDEAACFWLLLLRRNEAGWFKGRGVGKVECRLEKRRATSEENRPHLEASAGGRRALAEESHECSGRTKATPCYRRVAIDFVSGEPIDRKGTPTKRQLMTQSKMGLLLSPGSSVV
jgi:hypothetical protein